MSRPEERIAALPDAELARFTERLAAAWPDWEASASPVSPDGVVELALSRGEDRALVRIQRGDATVATVEDVAALAAERDLAFVVLAATGQTPERAVATARETDVELHDGPGLVALAREADVALPGDVPDLGAFLDARVAGYPDALAERTREVVRAIDEMAAFEREPSYGDASATLDFRLSDDPVARARFSPTSVLVYVATEDGRDGYETVATLTAYRDRQPSVEELDVRDAVERALESKT